MPSDSAGNKMDIQRKKRKDQKFLILILFVMMLAPLSGLESMLGLSLLPFITEYAGCHKK